MNVIASLLGGIGLFLIGIELMSNGLRESTGASLRRILADYTDKTSKALLSGFFVSTAVQSASAVIITLIGFVNARLLKLKHAIDVVLGANFGKVATAWIIVTFGFKFSITEFALPMIGIGAIIKVFFKNKEGIGTGLLGFGMIFFGLALLKTSVSTLQIDLEFPLLHSPGFLSSFLYLLLGVLMTVITQSSAGAMAMTFAALSGNVITLEIATALVIGQNMGATTNAILASQKTSAVAKQLMASHTFFNFLCTVVGFVILQVCLWGDFFPWLSKTLIGDEMITVTVLYSLSILMTLLLVLFYQDSFEKFIRKRFTKTVTLGTPRFLDRNKSYFPGVALTALRKEVERFAKISCDMIEAALTWESKGGWIYGPNLTHEERELDRLVQEIYDFSSRTARKQSSTEVIDAVQSFSLAVRYFEDAADYSKKISEQLEKMTEPMNEALAFRALLKWIESLYKLLPRIQNVIHSHDSTELKNLEAEYSLLEDEKTPLRQAFLDAGAHKEIDSSQTIVFIDLIDKCRRALSSQLRGIRKTLEITYDFSEVTAIKQVKEEGL